jgi:hypothetical protein
MSRLKRLLGKYRMAQNRCTLQQCVVKYSANLLLTEKKRFFEMKSSTKNAQSTKIFWGSIRAPELHRI